MLEKIKELQRQLTDQAEQQHISASEIRAKYLSKKGILANLFDEFKTVSVEKKKEVGQTLNEFKNTISLTINKLTEQATAAPDETLSGIDLTAPPNPLEIGSRHPLSIIKQRVLDIFFSMGFNLSEGPEIEDDWHVFSALNFPPEHPARDMQDTFFIQHTPDILLRTHTSSVQVREMESGELPIRSVSLGRVFRNEAISARAHCIFHQVEALCIDTSSSMASLKQTINTFCKNLFGDKTKVRMRPSYFPFTEPSAEVDIECIFCQGKGTCNVCKSTGWLEIMGCGMVDPNVLTNNNIDATTYSGYALGMGIERIAMLLFGVNDLRRFFNHDIRFLEQFKQTVSV